MNNDKIAVIGLGYVGLPLAHAFTSKYEVIGYDIAAWRIKELSERHDRTLELSGEQLEEAFGNGFTVTDKLEDIAQCNIYIVTVPTPIDKHTKPDFSPLIGASKAVSKVLKEGDIVIYESTVYPGATEEVCVPLLEEGSGLVFNKDFYCGYSPERINPGDKEHTVTKILKVTSGSTPEIGERVNALYASIITAGTYLAPTMKVAEAAKVIENSQRDINIAFVNELAVIFGKLGIDTNEVLKAAGTKWNFLPFRPGLVGGHCIGVDPYYLAYKAQEVGYNPEIILSGRRVNDNMGIYVANQVIKLMIHKGHNVEKSKVLVLGLTFKEECPDIRNSKVIDVIHELSEFGCAVSVADYWADAQEVKHEYGLDLVDDATLDMSSFEAVVVAVGHKKYKELSFAPHQVVYDVKSVLKEADGRL